MSSFDVRIFAIRRRSGRAAFEVRWRVASRDRSRSFMTRALADSHRAELVRAARLGQAFDPATGEPVAWAEAEPVTVTWYQHAGAYAETKWPHLAPHSRASLADALATITPLLTRETSRRPPDGTLRAALYGYAFNPQRRSRAPDPATASTLEWLDRASLLLCVSASSATRRSFGPPWTGCARGWTAHPPRRTRSPASGLRSTACSATPWSSGCCPPTPLGLVCWHAPAAATAVNPATVASPAQVRAILDHAARERPGLVAFFGCLYYAALRPEEAVALRREDLILPENGHGRIILAAACPRTGTAWTGTGTPHEPRGLKHRPDGAIRVVPIPPVLARMLRRHLRQFGTAPDGRLFPGTRGGILSESVYGRAWHAARLAALGPELAVTALARRPYDLRHAALSLWLNATNAPAEVATRAGNSARVLHEVYLHCIDSQEDIVSQRIQEALDTGTSSSLPPQCVKASGCAHRRLPL